MIVSQTKRAYYDKDGSLAQMDTLRTIRRKDVPLQLKIGNHIPPQSITYCKPNKSQQHSFCRISLISIVILSIIGLLLAIISSNNGKISSESILIGYKAKLKQNLNYTIQDYYNDNKFNKDEWESFTDNFMKEIKCTHQNDKIICQL